MKGILKTAGGGYRRSTTLAILLALLALLVLAGCADPSSAAAEGKSMSFSVSSRSLEGEGDGSSSTGSMPESFSLFIWTEDAAGNESLYVDNMVFTLSGSSYTTSDGIHPVWKDLDSTHLFVAVSPAFDPDVTVEGNTAVGITANTDILYATAESVATNDPIAITFDHLLARIETPEITKKASVEGETLVSVKLSAKNADTLDVRSGAITSSSELQVIDVTSNPVYIPAQTLDAFTISLSGDNTFIVTPDPDSVVAGKSYGYTFTVGQDEVSSGNSISGRTESGSAISGNLREAGV